LLAWLRQDADVSIRRRALDLVLALVNEDNIQALTTELLDYLKVSWSYLSPRCVGSRASFSSQVPCNVACEAHQAIFCATLRCAVCGPLHTICAPGALQQCRK
jgi:hypothetical protein